MRDRNSLCGCSSANRTGASPNLPSCGRRLEAEIIDSLASMGVGPERSGFRWAPLMNRIRPFEQAAYETNVTSLAPYTVLRIEDLRQADHEVWKGSSGDNLLPAGLQHKP